jgi:hypothetical protein
MPWDSSRPVPWRRLLREWSIYVAVMALAFAIFVRDWQLIGVVVGLLISLPLYLGVGYVLAKLGYERTKLRRGRPQAGAAADAASSPARARPAPTRRTSAGPTTRPAGKRRR